MGKATMLSEHTKEKYGAQEEVGGMQGCLMLGMVKTVACFIHVMKNP